MGKFAPQTSDDLVRADFALAKRLQHDEHATRVGGASAAAATSAPARTTLFNMGDTPRFGLGNDCEANV